MDNIKELLTRAEAKTDRSHYRTIVKAGNHIVVIDEPVAAGGEDAGISPQQLLLASLGSCTTITLQMYVDRKMWAVDKIAVGMEMFKISGNTVIEIKLDFEGDLSDEQKKRLVQIAEACPIHKLLSCKVIFETGLKQA